VSIPRGAARPGARGRGLARALGFYLNPFSARRCVLLTMLDREACRARLRANTLHPYSLRLWFPALSRAPLAGTVGPGGFSVRPRSHYGYRPQLVASGHWTGTPDGTRVALDLTLDGPGRCLMLLAYLLLLPFALAVLAGGLGLMPTADGPGEASPFALLVGASSLVVHGLAIVGIRRWLERTDGELLVGSVSELLEARPDEAAAAPARRSE
jgi:hypothetical protein